MASIPNFTAAERGMLAWIRQQTQTGPNAWARFVGTRKELSAVAEHMQVVPAVFTVYNGHVVKTADEYSATLVHRWFVVLAIANAASQNEAQPLNADAGPLLQQLHGLHGLTMPGCTSALVPFTPPLPYYGESKFAYFPLGFQHEAVSCTDPQIYIPPAN